MAITSDIHIGIFVSILTSVVSAILVFILQSVIKENRALKQEREENNSKREKAKEDGIRCLLRVRLIEYHAEYTEKGYISNHALQNWNDMYDSYHNLGGNHGVDHLNEEIKELHVKR